MPDNKDKVAILHETVSKDYDIGTLDEFKKKLSIPEKRKAFYEGVGSEYSLGSFDEFEAKVAPVKKKDSPYSTPQEQPYSNLGMPYASGEKNKSISEKFVAGQQKNVKTNQYDARQTANRTDPMAYLKTDATKFGAKVEEMQSAAVKANEKGIATDFQKQLVTDIGGVENIANKNKAQEMEGYLQTIRSNSATAFASLLKAPKGLALLLASNPLNNNVAKPTDKSVPEWTNYLDNIAHRVTDEIKKEDEFIADNLGKETSVSKSFANGDIKNGLHLLGKGMVASLTQLPLYLNPYVLAANTVSAASDEQHNNPNSPNLWSETYKKGFENTLGLMFGNSKVFSDLFKSAGKEGTKVALQEFKKTFGKEAAKAYGSEIAEELTVVVNNRVIDAVNGKVNNTPISQELTDTLISTAAMTAGFQAVSKLVPSGEIKSSDNDLNKSGISYYQEMLDNHKNKSITLTQQQIDGCKKSIEILNKRVEQYDKQEFDAKSKVPPKDPNEPELPPNTGGSGNLVSPEGVQQAGSQQQQSTFEDVMSFSQHQGDAPNADENNIDLTQLAQANQVIQDVIQHDQIATSVDGQPVDIQELTPEGVVLIDGTIVPLDKVMTESEQGPIPLVDLINEHIDSNQQQEQQQQEAVNVLNQELEQQGLTTEGKIVAIDDVNNNVTFEDGSNMPMENVNIIDVNTGQKVTSLPEYLQQPTQTQQQEQYTKDDIKIISNFGALFGANAQSKRVDILSKINNPTVKEIFHNFDSIIEQLGYTKSPDADC